MKKFILTMTQDDDGKISIDRDCSENGFTTFELLGLFETEKFQLLTELMIINKDTI